MMDALDESEVPRMSAMEKVAWTELLVSVLAIVVVTLLFPWLGNAATGGFGLLGLLGCSVWFVRKRRQKVIVDERDIAIQRRATELGVHVAWLLLFLSLAGLVFWSSSYNNHVVQTSILNWLIWIQLAICYGVKGLAGVLMYRKQRHDS